MFILRNCHIFQIGFPHLYGLQQCMNIPTSLYNLHQQLLLFVRKYGMNIKIEEENHVRIAMRNNAVLHKLAEAKGKQGSQWGI